MFSNIVPNSSLDKESVNFTKFLDVFSIFPKVEESERSFEFIRILILLERLLIFLTLSVIPFKANFKLFCDS